ncbi:TIR domain-containing protein [Chloroflexi bacterium TSY]|nr:TIR domain-containing protein [Chloroflexi bacterium TSY]
MFVSYDRKDQAWVEGYLLDAFEQSNFKIYTTQSSHIQQPNFADLEQALLRSHRTLLILTPVFLRDQYALLVEVLTHLFGASNNTWPIIPLMLKHIELPPQLQSADFIDATEPDNWSLIIDELYAEFDLDQKLLSQTPISPCPYPGMSSFSETNSPHFCGRSNEINYLQQSLRLHPIIAVIGPSGSGKSSLVMAGLIPALRNDKHLFTAGEWNIKVIRPGAFQWIHSLKR